MDNIRVLLADDQLPYENDEKNEAVRRAIIDVKGDELREEREGS